MQSFEGGDSHVQEHPEQHRHGDVAQHGRQEDGHTDGEEYQNVRHPLLPDAQELGLVSGCRTFRFQLQGVHVVDGEHGGGHEPRQTHHRAYLDQDRQDEQVQVVAAT